MAQLVNLTEDQAWVKLVQYYASAKEGLDIRTLFANDPSRFSKLSIELGLPTPEDGGPFLLDYSKNLIDDNALALLLNLAKSRQVEATRDAMFTGGKINTTEGRAVLHTALRARADDPPVVLDGKNVIEDITRVLKQMEAFCGDVINGKWVGYTGKKITDVVNIGIGGSDLGPNMVCEALSQYRIGPKTHFVSMSTNLI
jgi:glucose-6-phosphate isomerase